MRSREELTEYGRDKILSLKNENLESAEEIILLGIATQLECILEVNLDIRDLLLEKKRIPQKGEFYYRD
jgi:hypothetical protein